MAQINGYVCDVCEQFALNRETWLKVSSYADKDSSCVDVCSNKCLIDLGRQRGGQEPIKRRYQKHDDDFKIEVVKHATDHSNAETARKYGISASLVARWKERYG